MNADKIKISPLILIQVLYLKTNLTTDKPEITRILNFKNYNPVQISVIRVISGKVLFFWGQSLMLAAHLPGNGVNQIEAGGVTRRSLPP
jgi:hypothetical protein